MSESVVDLKGQHESRLKEYEILSKKNNLTPVKVSGFFQKKVEHEINSLQSHQGPLYRMVYPSVEKMGGRQSFEVNDFVDDRENMPEASRQHFIHKYADRVLFLPLSHCLSNCMYCFRQDVLTEKEEAKQNTLSQSLEDKIESLVAYLNQDPHVEEVILSGGDPMMLSFKDLAYIFSSIRSRTSIRYFRLHTKAIVFDPKIFSEDKIILLKKYNCRLVFHIAHPYEICSEVSQAIVKLHSYGVKLYNQFPILRKVNDHHLVLLDLIKSLEDLNVRTLSVFYPDPVQYSSTYRIHFARLFKIIDEFHWNSPSWLNSMRFCQDSVFGKIRREDLLEYDPKKGYALFKRKDHIIKVPDHPKKDDSPGELKNLLWKSYT